MKWEYAGKVDLDSGCVMVCDPSYVYAAQLPGEDWAEFHDNLESEAHQLDHPSGFPGVGLVLKARKQEGTFPVYVRRREDGSILEAKIVFEERSDG